MSPSSAHPQSFSYCALAHLLHLFRVYLLLLTLGYHCQGSGLYLPPLDHSTCLSLSMSLPPKCGSLTPNPCHIMVCPFVWGNAYLEVNESFCICIYFFLFSQYLLPLLSFLPFLSVLHAHLSASGHYVWCFLTLPPRKKKKTIAG